MWAADITPDETPLEAGLEFCVRRDKQFIGSDALAEPSRAGCARSRSPTRARSRSATSRCASAARSSDA